MKRLEFAWGFEGEAMRTVLRAVAPAPRRGLLALLDQPTFDAGSLPADTRRSAGFVVLSVDVPKTYDRITGLLKANGPIRPTSSPWSRTRVRQQFGFDLRKDLIAGLGPRLAFYDAGPGRRRPAARATGPRR